MNRKSQVRAFHALAPARVENPFDDDDCEGTAHGDLVAREQPGSHKLSESERNHINRHEPDSTDRKDPAQAHVSVE